MPSNETLLMSLLVLEFPACVDSISSVIMLSSYCFRQWQRVERLNTALQIAWSIAACEKEPDWIKKIKTKTRSYTSVVEKPIWELHVKGRKISEWNCNSFMILAIDGSWLLTLYPSCPVNCENYKECRRARATVAVGLS